MRAHTIAILLSAFALSPARAGKGDDQDAKAVLQAFLQPGADAAALTRRLRPQGADYKAVFSGELARKAEAEYGKAWEGGKLVIARKDEQTELKVFSATTEELQAGSGEAREFPGGYRKIAPQLGKGLRFYRFKFVKPGESAGMAYDGLVFVNGHWAFFPKPFRLVAEPLPEVQEAR
jgi:hypothetical protein